MVFGWFKSEQRKRRRKVRLDRKHLEARARRFLKNYLNADEARKPHFYRAVEEASRQCQPAELGGLPPLELEDAEIAELTSGAALKMVLAREERGAPEKDDQIADFVTDACATVGIAYLPKRLRSLYRSGWAGAINGFTSSDSAIDEIEGQCHERDNFCHRFTAASTNRKFKSTRPDNLAVQDYQPEGRQATWHRYPGDAARYRRRVIEY
jgi:hypothetical protein